MSYLKPGETAASVAASEFGEVPRPPVDHRDAPPEPLSDDAIIAALTHHAEKMPPPARAAAAKACERIFENRTQAIKTLGEMAGVRAETERMRALCVRLLDVIVASNNEGLLATRAVSDAERALGGEA